MLFSKRNLDLWCRQDWRGNEEDEEDGRVDGRVHHDDQLHLQLSNWHWKCQWNILYRKQSNDGISANNIHNDFHQNMDQTLDKYLTRRLIYFEKKLVSTSKVTPAAFCDKAYQYHI